MTVSQLNFQMPVYLGSKNLGNDLKFKQEMIVKAEEKKWLDYVENSKSFPLGQKDFLKKEIQTWAKSILDTIGRLYLIGTSDHDFHRIVKQSLETLPTSLQRFSTDCEIFTTSRNQFKSQSQNVLDRL